MSTCMPPRLIQAVHAVQEARARTLGWTPRLCSIWQELIGFALGFIDWQTGWLKQPAEQGKSCMAGLLQMFVSGQFAGIGQLSLKMDESHLMAWACGTEMENLHVTPMLEYYTGRSGPQFRREGWKDILHPEDQEPTMRYCQERFLTRRPFTFGYQLQCYNGGYGRIVDHAQPWYLSDGSFAGYVGTMYQCPNGSLVVIGDERGRYEVVTPGRLPEK